MYSFPELIKKIREEAGLTQTDFAKKLKVSPILISMVETGQKPVSKKLIEKIAKKLEIHPMSITPFLLMNEEFSGAKIGKIEQKIIEQVEKMQELLIKKKSKLLK